MDGALTRSPVKQADRLIDARGGRLLCVHIRQRALDGAPSSTASVTVPQPAFFILAIPLDL
jgi:hypothetical protein